MAFDDVDDASFDSDDDDDVEEEAELWALVEDGNVCFV